MPLLWVRAGHTAFPTPSFRHTLPSPEEPRYAPDSEYHTFCKKRSKNSKIGQITTAFWRIFARLNISSYPEFAGEQATEHGKLTSI